MKFFRFALNLLMGLVLLHLQACAQQENYQDLDVQQFAQKMESPEVIVLDVRTDAELQAGFIPNARQINYRNANFEQQIEALDKSKTYLVYCHSGNRSAKSCALMSQKGFKNLFNLAGGISAWKDAQKEIKTAGLN